MASKQTSMTLPNDSEPALSTTLGDKSANRQSSSKGQLVGIKQMESGRWQVRMKLRKNSFYFGTFNTIEEAVRARYRKCFESNLADPPERKKKRIEKSNLHLKENELFSAHRHLNPRSERMCSSTQENERRRGETSCLEPLVEKVTDYPTLAPPSARRAAVNCWEAYVYDEIRRARARKKLEIDSQLAKQSKHSQLAKQSKRRDLLASSKSSSRLTKQQSVCSVDDPLLVARNREHEPRILETTTHTRFDQGLAFPTPTSSNEVEILNQKEDEFDPELLPKKESVLNFCVDEEYSQEPGTVRYVLASNPGLETSFPALKKDASGELLIASSTMHLAATQIAITGVANSERATRPGVKLSSSGRRWEAYAYDPIKKAKIYLGSYATADEAVEARNRKRLEFQLVRYGTKKKKTGSKPSPVSERDPPSIPLTGEGSYHMNTTMDDNVVPFDDPFANGEEEFSDLGIVNCYGELVGEYDRLDDQLWFCKSEEVEEEAD